MVDTRVTVVIPCYNAEQTLARTLDSVMAQTFENFSVMAVNDGSTDTTGEILADYKDRFPDRINYMSQDNQGQTVAKDVAIENTAGEYIALLDSDDLWENDKLKKQVSLLDADMSLGMCYTAAKIIDGTDKPFDTVSVSPVHRGSCHREFIIRNKVVASSVVIRRSALDEVGTFDRSFIACENWDLWIRLAEKFNIEFIDEPLTCYRVYAENMSKNFDRIFQCRMQVINKHLPIDSTDTELLSLRQDALYRAHAAFAGAYIDTLDLAAARRELRKAISIKPSVKNNYILLLKCLLGKHFFVTARDIKKRLTGNH